MKLAEVKTELSSKNILVPITSNDKPQIENELQEKWQKIVDLAARIIGVPAGLITRVHEKQLEVLLASNTDGNIFQKNLKLDLGMGWYCENVIGSRKELVLKNAYKSEYWKNDNPSLPFNMISYLGIPIVWPDGEVFGTFCMLDTKEQEYTDLYKDLLLSLREIIQNDLKSILDYNLVKYDVERKETQLREVHHQVKNHFNLLITTLRLQSLFEKEKLNVDSLLADIQSRITAISVIHDRLYHSMNLEKVNLGDYLTELCKHIISNLSSRKINFSHDCDELQVTAKISLPCGLIINELITNSLKHAFEKVDNPQININLKKETDGTIVLLYNDNGKGLSSSYSTDDARTLGITLIKHSSEQIDGVYSFENQDGFVFKLQFKL